MALVEIHWKPSAGRLRVFSALLIAVSVWLYAAFGAGHVAAVAAAIAVAAGLLGLVRPALVRPVYVAWMAIAFPIGWIVSHLLLAAVFYLVITPVGIIIRLCGHDPLQRRADRGAATYWKRREEPEDPSQYFKQF